MDMSEDQQGAEPPDGEPEIAEYPEAGPSWVGLWAVARHWVALLEQMFEPDLLCSTGISRRFALRCHRWLWSIEGLVRRLIIAAAAKLDVSPQREPAAAKPRPARPVKPSATIAFTVLPRLPGRQPRTGDRQAPAPQTQEHRHLAFPGDDLLRLFPHPGKRKARAASRRSPGPLQRRGRCSRWDPDYQCDLAKEQERNDRYVFGPFPERRERWQCEPRQRRRADRTSPYWKPPGGDVPEWKRLEQEWARVIPAPRLAGRIRTLIRVMQAPERWIARTARRLGADILARIRATPAPRLRRPKFDRGPAPLLEAELALAHAFDTS
ncbi:MAG TPA: hypothetical protein VFV70_05010 [Hyphomonadaceae bacterium]|nr:hypothetical protein [Hyphomonadaceae bacterium]